MNNNRVIWEVIPTLGGGGAEKMVLDLSDGLARKGYDVVVISLYDQTHATPGRIQYAKDHNIKVRYLNKKPGFDIQMLKRFISLIKSEKPDIIHSHIESFQYCAIAGWFIKFNHVHTMHSIVGKESKVYQYLLRRASMSKKTHFVVLSEQIGEKMIELFGTSKEFLSCIQNGIDRDFFKKEDRLFKAGPIHYIAVGSLNPVKNHRLLISAFANLQNEREFEDKLTILGEGTLRKSIEAQIREYRLERKVLLPGNVDDIRPYLQCADVFVMTSHYEGVSLALLEAASTGLPIIATKTGNTPIVVGEDAILIEDNDLKALKREMLKIAKDIQYRKQYADRALIIANRFDKKEMVKAYSDLYCDIMR